MRLSVGAILQSPRAKLGPPGGARSRDHTKGAALPIFQKQAYAALGKGPALV